MGLIKRSFDFKNNDNIFYKDLKIMNKSSVFIITAGTLWGLMGLFVRKFTNGYGFTSGETSSIRLILSGIIFFLLIAIKDFKLLKVKLKDFWVFVCLGFFSIYCMTNFYFKSMMSDTSISVSAILLYTAPIIVMVFSCVLFKERFTAKKLISLILAFFGCVLVCSVDGAKVTVTGFIYGLLSGFAYASYSIFGKIAMKRGYFSYTISGYSFIIAGIFSLLLGKPHIILQKFETLKLNLSLFVWVLAIALVTAILPFVFYTKGLEKTPAGKASVMASVEPLVATVCGLFLGEKITFSVILGIVGILSAIVILNTGEKMPPDKNKTKEVAKI